VAGIDRREDRPRRVAIANARNVGRARLAAEVTGVFGPRRSRRYRDQRVGCLVRRRAGAHVAEADATLLGHHEHRVRHHADAQVVKPLGRALVLKRVDGEGPDVGVGPRHVACLQGSSIVRAQAIEIHGAKLNGVVEMPGRLGEDQRGPGWLGRREDAGAQAFQLVPNEPLAMVVEREDSVRLRHAIAAHPDNCRKLKSCQALLFR